MRRQGRNKKYSRKQAESVIELCEAGMALKDITEKTGIIYEFVHRMIHGKYYPDMTCEGYKKFQGTSQEVKLTNVQARKMRDLHHEDGLRISEICGQFSDIDRALIIQVLQGKTYKDAGGEMFIRPYHLPYSEDDVIQARKWYLEGVATSAIADELGLSHHSVLHMLKSDKFDVGIEPVKLEKKRLDPAKMAIPPHERENIRTYYKSSNVTMQSLADLYDVDISYISLIVKGKR
jgi:hypothetical protein